jgi:hypothetical protein
MILIIKKLRELSTQSIIFALFASSSLPAGTVRLKSPTTNHLTNFTLKFFFVFFVSWWFMNSVFSQNKELLNNNIAWTTQSKNSSESMPCGGGDIGLNVWVENNEIYAYISRSGTFDENNTLLKLGRVKLKLTPNPFDGGTFKQELILKDGYVQITGIKGKLTAQVNVWVDVFNPIIHFDVKANQKISTQASYQSWRFEDRILRGKENNQNSYKWAPQGVVKTLKDSITFLYNSNQIRFYHQNKDRSVFDIAVEQQKLEHLKNQLYNPLAHLTFGGDMLGNNMVTDGTDNGIYNNIPYKSWKLKSYKPTNTQSILVYLFTKKDSELDRLNYSSAYDWAKTKKWWNNYWDRSFIYISSKNKEPNQVGKNYQLFRYMLGCNAYGKWPTKFNGGLFTYDPALVDTSYKFTPDFRNWGGGTHTAQNQRLVYWPMLKSGDFEMMEPQFDFYLDVLKAAELRTENAWGHKGASFTEQIENFGLPNQAEYSWKRPVGYDVGMEYNAWLEYEWDTVLEFCMMILETERYNGNKIDQYIPLIESCLTFFNEHYSYLANKKGVKPLDDNGYLVLYPGSAGETYKITTNSTSTIAALKTVLERLITLPNLSDDQRKKWQKMLKTIPPINFREFDGHATIAPAKKWERINNVESMQLYPVFPWGRYGIGRAGLDTAINTYTYDPDAIKFRSYVGWKQDNIFAARLGLTTEAARLTVLKLKDSGRRFPAFWGPGFDWTPDHNWGGSGMIGLQEMLMQCVDKKIYLFGAWPKEWDVHFKLHAPYKTTIEARLKDGKLIELKVTPISRTEDVVNMLK